MEQTKRFENKCELSRNRRKYKSTISSSIFSLICILNLLSPAECKTDDALQLARDCGCTSSMCEMSPSKCILAGACKYCRAPRIGRRAFDSTRLPVSMTSSRGFHDNDMMTSPKVMDWNAALSLPYEDLGGNTIDNMRSFSTDFEAGLDSFTNGLSSAPLPRYNRDDGGDLSQFSGQINQDKAIKILEHLLSISDFLYPPYDDNEHSGTSGKIMNYKDCDGKSNCLLEKSSTKRAMRLPKLSGKSALNSLYIPEVDSYLSAIKRDASSLLDCGCPGWCTGKWGHCIQAGACPGCKSPTVG